MKRIFLTVLLFNLLLTTTVAQNFIVDTEKLNNAYAALEKEPQNIRRQKDFFSAFPSCWNDFYSTYRYCNSDGYDLSMYNQAYEHVQALGKCTAINDSVFCNRLIALSVGASLDADAPNHLQTLLHNTMQEKNEVFLYCLSKIEKGHQMQFWQFYWSSITDSQDARKEYVELYNRNKAEYPEMMKIMSFAFDFFNNGVVFISDFENIDNGVERSE